MPTIDQTVAKISKRFIIRSGNNNNKTWRTDIEKRLKKGELKDLGKNTTGIITAVR